jgi:hypothetical protein
MNPAWKTLAFSLLCLSLACKTVNTPPEPVRPSPAEATPPPATDSGPRPGPVSSQAALAGLPATLPFHLEVSEGAKSLPRGVQSFAFATSGGKWLFVGGRTNGFHLTATSMRTFPVAYANKQLLVFDPGSGQSWSRDLPAAYLPQLSATNTESHQDGDTLYVAGGYGSNCGKDTASCYGTYPNLTALKVKDVIDAVVAGDDAKLASSIVSIEDARFQVAGGVLRKVGDYFYLVMGQNYSRIYSAAVSGAYTEQVRRFKLGFDGQTLTVSDYQAFGDPSGAQGTASQFHRRDLNVTEAITPSGNPGLNVWGGVFTADDRGWSHPIYIEPQGSAAPALTVDAAFQQKTNYYECANLLMYDAATGSMYTTLFGGISNYYYNQAGELVPGGTTNSLPFTNIISTLGRASNGTREYVQPMNQGLPALIGANAELVLAPGLPLVQGSHAIVDYAKLTGNRVLVGYLVGGIRATAWQASGTNPTYPLEKLYEVYVVRP